MYKNHRILVRLGKKYIDVYGYNYYKMTINPYIFLLKKVMPKL